MSGSGKISLLPDPADSVNGNTRRILCSEVLTILGRSPVEVRATDLGIILATEAETEAGRPGAAEKRAVWDEYGYPGKSDGQHWEYDHLVPIECGGDNDLKNIWPEPRVGPWNAWDKDRLEDASGKAIRDGSMTFAQAQALFLAPADWRVAYRRVFGSVPADAR